MSTARPFRRLIATGAVVSLSALVLAGCGGGDASAGMPEVAKYTPQGSAVLVQVDTSPANPGWGQLRDMLSNWTDLRAGIDEMLDSEQAQTAAKVLGGPMVIAAMPAPGVTARIGNVGDCVGGGDTCVEGPTGAVQAVANDMPVAVALDVSDTAKRDAALKDLGEPTETVAGQKAWVEDGTYLAAPAGALVMATDKAMLEKALKGQGPAGDLAEAVVRQPEDSLVRGAMLPNAVAAGVPGVEVASDALNVGAYGFAMDATATGVSITADAPEDMPLQGTAFAPTIWKDMPASTTAYVGFAGLADTVRQAVAQAEESDGDVSDAIAQLKTLGPTALGVSWQDLASITSAEHAIVAGGTKGAAWGALVLRVKDPEGAEKILDTTARGLVRTLRNLGADQPLTVAAVDIGSVKVTGVQMEDKTWITWGLRGDYAVIAIGTAKGLTDFFADGQPPASLGQAVGEAPDEVTNIIWMDAPKAAKALGASPAYMTQISQGLASVLGWSAGTESELDLLRP